MDLQTGSLKQNEKGMEMKIRKELLEQEKISYAMDHIELPEGGVDCSEGCNPYGFPPECAEVLKRFDPARLGPYPHSDALYDAIREFWKDQIDVERHNILLADGSINALYIINNIFDTHNSVVLGISPQFTDYYTESAHTQNWKETTRPLRPRSEFPPPYRVLH